MGVLAYTGTRVTGETSRTYSERRLRSSLRMPSSLRFTSNCSKGVFPTRSPNTQNGPMHARSSCLYRGKSVAEIQSAIPVSVTIDPDVACTQFFEESLYPACKVIGRLRSGRATGVAETHRLAPVPIAAFWHTACLLVTQQGNRRRDIMTYVMTKPCPICKQQLTKKKPTETVQSACAKHVWQG